ncbi:MAG: hypothetical protein AAFQ80_13355 [Cyanobacteria bacterium J06621_8]
MKNNFFNSDSLEKTAIKQRLWRLNNAKIGFYSVGLYPASLAYNAVMQKGSKSLLLAPRSGRDLLGAFSPKEIAGMDLEHTEKMRQISQHRQGNRTVVNDLEYLVNNCDIIILSANSKYIEEDLAEACRLKEKLNRHDVVLTCLAGSFSHDPQTNESYILCEKYPNLAFFSGFHRHGSLRNPFDSFTANFCHPNALTALIGAYLLNQLSPNIQISPGIHNVEAQYIKAAKNMSSIFAGFGYEYHRENPGVLPTLLTLLLNQCLDQAATVSMSRQDRQQLYNQTIALTELGYAIPRIEAVLNKGGSAEKVRDHTFSQLTAMVADVRGSMMLPVTGKPTRNFQAGKILARNMKKFNRCPHDIAEFEQWCSSKGLNTGALEGLKALRYWPQIEEKYSIPNHDASMVNLLYKGLYGTEEEKAYAFQVMTQSRQLSNYCQESVRHSHSRKYAESLENLTEIESLELISNAVIADNAKKAIRDNATTTEDRELSEDSPAYLKVMDSIVS